MNRGMIQARSVAPTGSPSAATFHRRGAEVTQRVIHSGVAHELMPRIRARIYKRELLSIPRKFPIDPPS